MASSSSSCCSTLFPAERLSAALRSVEELRRLHKQTRVLKASGLFDEGDMKANLATIERKIGTALARIDGLQQCVVTTKNKA